jgi:hypothetical protein
MAADMSEVRCPMCGKTNPADVEICQFCQARLVPLQAGGQTQTPQPTAASPQDSSSLDDWLNALRASDDHPHEEDSAAEEHQDAFDAEGLEWLRADAAVGVSESGTPAADEGGADWMKGLLPSDEGAGFVEGSQPAEDRLEDWPPAPDVTADDSVPEWLSEIGKAGSPAEAAAASDAADAGEAAEGEPDWLSRIRSRRSAETSTAEGSQAGGEVPVQPLADDNVSAWLAELRGDEAAQAELAPATADEPLSAEPVVSADALIGGEDLRSTEVEGEVSVQLEAPAVEEKDAPEITQGPEDQIPDWLAGLVAGKAVAGGMAKVETDSEGLPDWLAGLEKSTTLDQGVIVPFGEEEPGLTFDWLQEQVRADQVASAMDTSQEAEAQPGSPAESVSPFEGDLSDFLEAGYPRAPKTEAAELVAEDLSPAELPTWLEAMRPVEAAALGLVGEAERDAQVETSGPLAGLRGVLPAEPDIARLKKPPAYALRLQVTDSQQASADLMASLLQNEAEPKALPERPVISSQYVFRLIIFAALLIPIVWAAFANSQAVPLPALPQEVFDTTSVVNALPDNPLVLLAVDYEPGLSGEMQAASAALVDQLMLKGAYLAMVSTSTNGPALAENLVRSTADRSGHVYEDVSQYANLGYIPGGAAGLASFADAPRKTSPYALDPQSTYVWGQPPLQTAEQLSDFNLVAVITDNADKSRSWIEQVQPSLGDTPMVMVVSAQAEPMVRPYYYSTQKQIQGMVAGLAGSSAYENAHQDLLAGAGPARRYWDAFSYSLLVAATLVALGVIISLAASGFDARKQSMGDKKS